MEQQGLFTASNMIESLTSWWELAGVDGAVGELPVDWLELQPKADDVGKAEASTAISSDIPAQLPDPPAVDWPQEIEALKMMITSGADLPGNRFGPAFVAPTGPANCDIMLVSDLPDRDEAAAARLGSGATGILLARMLAAIGVKLSDCYWTTLATTIPPTGEVPEGALNNLADFTRHQIGLAQPQSVILLGSTACKALLGEELMKARQTLGNINHNGRNMAVLTTFHPRTLIARPAMKAQAWKDLQMFAKRADL